MKRQFDDTGFGGLKVIRGSGFSYGVDAVLLAGFAACDTGIRPEECGSAIRRSFRGKTLAAEQTVVDGNSLRIADLGSGNGAVSFILWHKLLRRTKASAHITGIELQRDPYERAEEAASLNSIEDSVDFINTDVKNILEKGGAGDSLTAGSCDAVVMNPPYFKRGAHMASPNEERHISRHETTAELGDFLRTSALLLRRSGDLFMIHRPGRLTDILMEMRSCGIEPRHIQFVLPRPGADANLMLVHGIKGAGEDLRVLHSIAVHSSDDVQNRSGGYTEEIERMYERI